MIERESTDEPTLMRSLLNINIRGWNGVMYVGEEPVERIQ